ncbi:MAG: NUDIX hydrolase [Turicibacter sp.]
MGTQGAFAVIINEEKKVLLVKRRDYPIWDLPGGRVDPGESVVDCAIREAKEETGVDIKVMEKVGEYIRPKFDDIQHVFTGEITGGELFLKTDESCKIAFFPLDRLPMLMVPNRRHQIKDYVSGKREIIKTLNDDNKWVNMIQKLKRN